MMMKEIRNWFNRPFSFDMIYKNIQNKTINYLDVGCGSHAATIAKKFFPQIKYYGLDFDRNFHNDDSDFKLMEEFYQVDLTKIEMLKKVPENFFDFYIMSHVLEHIANGEEVLLELKNKLKVNGFAYIEFPSLHSHKLPQIGEGTLNFHKDPTHVRQYDYKEISKLLKENGFEILSAGVRRGWKRIVFLPIYILRSFIDGKGLRSGHLYDITGFASYVFAKKINE